jgi:hypothetical protein
MHPSVIEHYYGVEGTARNGPAPHSGAGYTAEESKVHENGETHGLDVGKDSDADANKDSSEDSGSGYSDEDSDERKQDEYSDWEEDVDNGEGDRDEVDQLDEISDCDDEQLVLGEVELEDKIGDEQEVKNICHEPVPVPKHANPFQDNEMEIFTGAIVEMTKSGGNPRGYDLLPEEWGADGYPSYEVIKVGCVRKEKRILLPDHTWRPRAELWGRGLYLLNSIMYKHGANN